VKPLAHIAVSGVISFIVWAYFKSFGCALVSFATGVFIDLDHLVDYYANHRFTLSAKRIYCACIRIRFKRLLLLLHSYEILLALWIAIYVFSLSDIWKAAAIGLTQHVIFDQVTNPINTFGYFLTYRMAMGFSRDRIIREMAIGMARCRR
jgi:hypothetical protein